MVPPLWTHETARRVASASNAEPEPEGMSCVDQHLRWCRKQIVAHLHLTPMPWPCHPWSFEQHTDKLLYTQVLASVAQCTSGHPLHHAAMVVIAAIAERDRRLWPEHDAAALRLEADHLTVSAEDRCTAAVDDGVHVIMPILRRAAQQNESYRAECAKSL